MIFNDLIIKLLVIQNIANDIHYLCYGSAFYSKHIFVDEIKFRKEIDKIKEVCLLGSNTRPLQNKEYLKSAVDLLPELKEKDDKFNFNTLLYEIEKALDFIETMQGLKTGEANLIGGIAEKLQQFKGLLNLQIEE